MFARQGTVHAAATQPGKRMAWMMGTHLIKDDLTTGPLIRCAEIETRFGSPIPFDLESLGDLDAGRRTAWVIDCWFNRAGVQGRFELADAASKNYTVCSEEMASRDEFSEPTKRVIAARVGFRCSRPDCQAETAGPTRDTSKSVNVGVAAHITAAAVGGPRYDATLTAEQRKHAENGIWLCQTHAKDIDDDTIAHPVDLLRSWKHAAEKRARGRLGKATTADSLGGHTVTVSDAERYGLATAAILEDGRQIPMASPFDPNENKPTFYASPSYVVRFMVLKHPDAQTVLISEIRATCYKWSELPEYGTAAYAFPVMVNPYLVTLIPPIDGKPRPCIAELYFHEDLDAPIRFSPMALTPDVPEVIDVRFNAVQSGVYTPALQKSRGLGVGVNRAKQM